ncbi:MAG: TlpA family protein disulfide reductase [Acholeplasmataceae bacterium]|nr:TlpA family protein disulfide reductase [Acholeplasmataceae bacterium]
MNGNIVSQEIFSKADLTMVNIWGTFCGPCIREMPILAELSQEYADKGVQIVGIVIDATDNNGNVQQEQMTAANKILANANAKYLNLVPSYGMLSNQLRVVMAIPTTTFVNKQGEIVGAAIVGSKDKESWIKIIDSLR